MITMANHLETSLCIAHKSSDLIVLALTGTLLLRLVHQRPLIILAHQTIPSMLLRQTHGTLVD